MKSRDIKLVLVTFCSVISALFLFGCSSNQDKSTQIFKIPNTDEIINLKGGIYTEITLHYMIINPPEDLHQLKVLVNKHIGENNSKFPKRTERPRTFDILFYRESKRLPRNWQPSADDDIYEHGDDCIGGVRWSDDKPEKIYDLYKISTDDKNYGAILEEMH